MIDAGPGDQYALRLCAIANYIAPMNLAGLPQIAANR